MHLWCKYKVITSNGYLFMDICLSHWLQWKNWTLTHKIKKWGCSDFILHLPCIIHLRCSQVWYGTPRPGDLKTIYLFRWKPIYLYCKCLLQLWTWQRPNWSGCCMLGRSSIDVSTLRITRGPWTLMFCLYAVFTTYQNHQLTYRLATLKVN